MEEVRLDHGFSFLTLNALTETHIFIHAVTVTLRSDLSTSQFMYSDT